DPDDRHAASSSCLWQRPRPGMRLLSERGMGLATEPSSSDHPRAGSRSRGRSVTNSSLWLPIPDRQIRSAKVQAFLAAHPESARALAVIKAEKLSSGFENTTYHGLPVPLLVVDGARHVDGRMPAPSVVDGFQPVHGRCPCPSACWPGRR